MADIKWIILKSSLNFGQDARIRKCIVVRNCFKNIENNIDFA